MKVSAHLGMRQTAWNLAFAFGPACGVALIVALFFLTTSGWLWEYDVARRYLDVAKWGMMQAEGLNPLMIGDSVSYIAILGMMVLLALNSCMVLGQFFADYNHDSDFGIRFSPVAKEKRALIRRFRSAALLLLGATAIFLVLWMSFSFTGKFLEWGVDLGTGWTSPSQQLVGHEFVSLCVFMAFLIMDVLLLVAVRKEREFWREICERGPLNVAPDQIQETRAEVMQRIGRLLHEERFQRDSIWLVDIPVLIGVLCIGVFSHVAADRAPFLMAERQAPFAEDVLPLPPPGLDLYLRDHERDQLLVRVDDHGARTPSLPTYAAKVSRERQLRRFEGLLQGISTGGLVMHIAISQVVLGVLLYRLRRDVMLVGQDGNTQTTCAVCPAIAARET